MCQAKKSFADFALLVAAREDIVVPAERVVEIRDQRLATAEVATDRRIWTFPISSSPSARLKPSMGLSKLARHGPMTNNK
jgi:hypothetical protein